MTDFQGEQTGKVSWFIPAAVTELKTWWLTNSKNFIELMVLEDGSPRSWHQQGRVGPLPGSQTADFSRCPHMEQGAGSSEVSLGH